MNSSVIEHKCNANAFDPADMKSFQAVDQRVDESFNIVSMDDYKKQVEETKKLAEMYTAEATEKEQLKMQLNALHAELQSFKASTETSRQSSFSTAPKQINVNFQNNRTVKVFKHYVFGPHLETVQFSIGDSGAEVTLIREDLRQHLGIEGTPTSINLQWTDGSVKSTPAMRVTLELRGLGDDAETLTLENCYAVSDLNLPPRSLDVDRLKLQFPYLKNIDFEAYENAIPVLLIGSPHAACFEAIEPIVEDGEGKPVALKSKLGWSIFGGQPELYPETPYAVQNVTVTQTEECDANKKEVTNEELSELLTNFSSIENLGIRPIPESHLTQNEQKAIEIIKEELKILPNGSVEVPLIWNRHDKVIPRLPNNYVMVWKRQCAHEKKLAKNLEHLNAFNENFKDLIKEGYVRRATAQDLNTLWDNVWYLPMSLVINANKIPVKYRNVYDASATYQGVSLNDHLLMGSNLLVDILQPLFKMRMDKIAFTCDVKSMFHRIFICHRDQQCQRILWRENDDEEMGIYIQQVCLFGPKSSPFTSQIVKNLTADKFNEKYPLAADTLKHHTYMDDVLTSAPTVDAAVDLAKQCIEIFRSINWDLIGFQSNSLDFMRKLPDTHIKQELIPILTGETENKTTKVLGCAWDTKADCFVFELNKHAFVRIVKECGHRPTKRDQSSTIARIFDALGLIAHFVIRGRILLQRSWRNKLQWDQEITEEEHKTWIKWLDEIENIAKLKIPRLYTKSNDISKVEKLELHVMCDAGKEAFAAVAYLVSQFRDFRHSTLVMAKAKVTPLQKKSKLEIHELPRLELLSCLIGARLADTISRLHKNVKFERFIWSDSEVVLRWIKNPNQNLIRFAISPIHEILEKTEREEWLYVPSKLNAADIATKFQAFDFGDVNSIWFKGPKFLEMPRDCWPQQKNEGGIGDPTETVLMGSIKINAIKYESPVKLPPINCPLASDAIIDRLSNSIKSNWIKLLRAIARSLKLYDAMIALIKSKEFAIPKASKEMRERFKCHQLEPIDLQRAELFIIRKMQREACTKDYKALLKGQFASNTELLQLHVFLDDQKVMRIDSRVNLKREKYPQRFAPFVPRKHMLTTILLYYYHEAYAHIHLESQVAAVRASFWIPNLRTALNAIRSNCNHCRAVTIMSPVMAPLPDFRLDPELNPFEITGVDCTGALTYYNHNTPKKAYVMLFTCTVTRLIHAALIDKMDTLSVLEAIVQFWPAHGPVSKFISDNGTNFVGAAKRLKRDQEDVPELLKQQGKALKPILSEKYRLSWDFIPPYSPWFGGFYERLIKEVKRSIELTVKNKRICRKALNIAIQDGVHRINCRPLTHNPLNADDEEVLTPHLLAKHRSGWPLLPSRIKPNYNHTDKDDRLIYHRGRAIADEIAKRFTSEYLPVLTKRTKWLKEKQDFAVGDLVLLIEPNQTRGPYQRARVTDIHTGRDGHVRVIDVRLPDGTVRDRYSVQRCARLEIKKLENAL